MYKLKLNITNISSSTFAFSSLSKSSLHSSLRSVLLELTPLTIQKGHTYIDEVHKASTKSKQSPVYILTSKITCNELYIWNGTVLLHTKLNQEYNLLSVKAQNICLYWRRKYFNAKIKDTNLEQHCNSKFTLWKNLEKWLCGNLRLQ